MAWSPYQIALALLMVTTGSINTLTTKWADMTESVGRDGGHPRPFNHPFLQATAMFLGEFLCMIAFFVIRRCYSKRNVSEESYPPSVRGNRKYNPFIFLAPAMCDMIGTSIMYVGLNLTYASSFQMLRGAVIIFTGLLSVAFLHRNLRCYEWLGMFVVVCGLVIVGMSDILYTKDTSHNGTNNRITGDLLIILAQIITATQMVVEEKFVGEQNVPPLQAVGWEGFFGFVVLSLLLIPMYYIPVGHQIFDNPNGNMEDAIDGFYQIGNSWKVALGISGTIISIAFFNFAGISVTKEISATTRMVLDSVRTLVIWMFSLAVSWQNFNYLQPIGFLVLVIGMCLYNDVIIRPFLIKQGLLSAMDSERLPIIAKVEDYETNNGYSPYPPKELSQDDFIPNSIGSIQDNPRA